MNELSFINEEDLAMMNSFLLGFITAISSIPSTMMIADVLCSTCYIAGKDLLIKDLGVSQIDDHLTYGVEA